MYEDIFLSAKRIAENKIAVKVDMDKARAQDPFAHIALWSDSGDNFRKNINVFAGEFQQNLLAYVDNFPSVVWTIENWGETAYPGHLIIELPAAQTSILQVHIVNRMQQYNEPAEIYTLDVTD
ncbi:hypothetical protein GWD52_19240 [Enterobacteriaceae bacterium 4M9]|nr:hypothetical protein [Enterobacteriaceae bacterium 4M9]